MRIFSKALMLANLLLVAAFSLKAQNKDYVVTIDGTRIPCTITFPMFHEGGVYKTAEMRETVPISMDKIKEYFTSKDGILHRRVSKHPGKRGSSLFMVVLEDGKINLYQEEVTTNVGTSSMSSTTWYVSKGSDTLTAIKNADFSISGIFFKSRKSRENAFGEMIRDNKEVYDKYIAEEKFSFKQVRDLVHLYNTGRSFDSDQPRDYVVTKNKDTIFCEIKPGTFNSLSSYRATPKDRFIIIDANISSYFLAKDSATFLLKTLPNDKHPKFVKCLATGDINLYAYSLNNAAADNESTLYASKQQGDMVLLKDEFHKPGKNEKNAFTALISDNPTVAQKLTNLPYNFSTIFDRVKLYDSDHLKHQ